MFTTRKRRLVHSDVGAKDTLARLLRRQHLTLHVVLLNPVRVLPAFGGVLRCSNLLRWKWQ